MVQDGIEWDLPSVSVATHSEPTEGRFEATRSSLPTGYMSQLEVPAKTWDPSDNIPTLSAHGNMDIIASTGLLGDLNAGLAGLSLGGHSYGVGSEVTGFSSAYSLPTVWGVRCVPLLLDSILYLMPGLLLCLDPSQSLTRCRLIRLSM